MVPFFPYHWFLSFINLDASFASCPLSCRVINTSSRPQLSIRQATPRAHGPSCPFLSLSGSKGNKTWVPGSSLMPCWLWWDSSALIIAYDCHRMLWASPQNLPVPTLDYMPCKNSFQTLPRCLLSLPKNTRDYSFQLCQSTVIQKKSRAWSTELLPSYIPRGSNFSSHLPWQSQGWAGVGHKTEQLSGHFLSPDAPALPALLSQWLLLLSDSCPRSLLPRDVCSHSTALPAPSHLASSLSLEAPPKDTCPARSLALCSPFQRVLALISLFLPSPAQAPVQFLP